MAKQKVDHRFKSGWQRQWHCPNNTYNITGETVGGRWFVPESQVGAKRLTITRRSLWQHTVNDILRLLKLSKLKLAPPCMCTIIDVFVDESQQLYFVFEAPGQSLHERFLEENKFDRDVARNYMFQLLVAALFLQYQHVPLPYITPSSIFLGENNRIMLAPMGGIKEWHLMIERVGDTNEYRICAPPEYFAGTENGVTDSSVVWNLACIYVEMISFKPLFVARNSNVFDKDVFTKYLGDCAKLFRCPRNESFGAWADMLRIKGLPEIDDILHSNEEEDPLKAGFFDKLVRGDVDFYRSWLLHLMLKIAPKERYGLEHAVLSKHFSEDPNGSSDGSTAMELQYLLKDYRGVRDIYTPWEVDVLMTVSSFRTNSIATLNECVTEKTEHSSHDYNALASTLEIQNDGWTLQHTLAAKGGDVDAILMLIEMGKAVDLKDNNGLTMLHWAVYDSHVEALQLLVERGADVNAKDNYGQTALHLAANGGHVEALRFLVERGADVNARSNNRRTALHSVANSNSDHFEEFLAEHEADEDGVVLYWVACGASTEALQFLVERGADVNAKNFSGQTALHDEAARFLVECGADVNAKDSNERTALHCAASGGHVEIVRLLVECGADVNAEDNYRSTALHDAVLGGDIETLRFLVERGADINAKDSNGFVALNHAALYRRIKALRFLVECGADINAKVLHSAASGGDIEVVRFLVECEADVNAKNDFGCTALHNAASGGHVEALRLLLERGVDIDAKDNIGRTGLHLAASVGGGDDKALRFLAEHGADIHAKDNYEGTALHYAAEAGNVEALRFLVAHGADINARDYEGKTALGRGFLQEEAQQFLEECVAKAREMTGEQR